jgi:hypothetical protein
VQPEPGVSDAEREHGTNLDADGVHGRIDDGRESGEEAVLAFGGKDSGGPGATHRDSTATE